MGGDTRYEPIFTGSMEPAIRVGSIVVIKPFNPESLKEGDIICFKLSEPTSITHRIINITDEGFITKGDANKDPDQWIVRTPIGFILLIIIPATLLIVTEIKNIIKYRKK